MPKSPQAQPPFDERIESLCIYPIGGMAGYQNGPERLQIGDVRFARAEVVSRDWISLGFKADPIARIQEWNPKELDATDVVAIVRVQNHPASSEEVAKDSAVHALKLLLSCNPAWGPSDKRRPVIPGISKGRLLGFYYAQDLTARVPDHVKFVSQSSDHEIRLDGFWERNAESGFYKELNELLERNQSEWERRLLEVSSLLGAARLAGTHWESFLCSMIGIERLLKQPKEAWKKRIPPTLAALFGWLSASRGAWYAQQLDKLYALRNDLVHEGRTQKITLRHAQLSDEVLFNVISLAMKHLKQATSFEKLLEQAQLVAQQKSEGQTPTALPNAVVVHSI